MFVNTPPRRRRSNKQRTKWASASDRILF